MKPTRDIQCVQAQGWAGFKAHVEHSKIKFRVPFRFGATSRGRGPQLCRLKTQHPSKLVIRATPEKSVGGQFPTERDSGQSRAPSLNRKGKAPAHNACALDSQIINRAAVKSGGWITKTNKPAHLKRLLAESNVARRAYVNGLGFRLVKAPRMSKNALGSSQAMIVFNKAINS
jgi:hypothetical protein